jgi:TctA family transporter
LIYSIGNNTGDVLIMLTLDLGYLMRKFATMEHRWSALVLGGELESSFRQSLMLSRGFHLLLPSHSFGF